MAVRFDPIANKLITKYVKTVGDIMTGNLTVSKADPEIRLTDTGDSEYSRITRTDTSKKAIRYNRVTQPASAGSAVDLVSASSQYMSYATGSNLEFNQITISFWIKPHPLITDNEQHIWSTGAIYSSYNRCEFKNNTFLVHSLAASDRYNPSIMSSNSGVLNDNAWNHVCIGVDNTQPDGTGWFLYVNGVDQKSGVSTGGSGARYASTGEFRIGSDQWTGTPGRYFPDMQFDEIAVFNTLKNTTFIASIYNSGAGAQVSTSEAGLVSLWRLDEGSGTNADDIKSNYDLTLNNTPGWVTGIIAGASSVEEATVWSSQDATVGGEKGIQTFGDSGGRTILQGKSIQIGTIGTVNATLGTITTLNSTTGTVTALTATRGTFGDATNYTYVDGTLGPRMYGSATTWEDLQVDIGRIRTGPTGTAPTWGTMNGAEVLLFGNGTINSISFTTQVPHRAKVGGSVEYHVHVSPTGTHTGDIVWRFTHSWVGINGSFPTASTITGTQTIGTGVVDKHILFSVGNLGTNPGISSMLLCTLDRFGTVATDTFGTPIRLLQSDFHYEVDSAGSDEQTTKT